MPGTRVKEFHCWTTRLSGRPCFRIATLLNGPTPICNKCDWGIPNTRPIEELFHPLKGIPHHIYHKDGCPKPRSSLRGDLAKIATNIPSLIKALRKSHDPKEKMAIRRELRKLGHRGGLRG